MGRIVNVEADLHRQPPLKRPGEQPFPDTLVVTAADHAKDLPRIKIHMVVIHGSNRVQVFVDGS